MQCKICHAVAVAAFTARVLAKYDVIYYRCEDCGFMQTEEPYWLDEAYACAINEIDLGPVNRAITCHKLTEGIILSSFNRHARFIDYGAGYGIYVRLMRDRGFDYYWRDRYCENIFAKHFIAEPGVKYELLTAFEVFEHLVQPLEEIETMLEYSSNLLFSTLLVPPEAGPGWWYFGPDHGQHIAFYTVPALQMVAERFKLHLSSDGVETHLLSKRPVSERLLRFFARNTLSSRIARQLLRQRLRKQSLLLDDFRAVSGYNV